MVAFFPRIGTSTVPDLIGDFPDGVASPGSIKALRDRHADFGKPDDRVAVYQNQALDSANSGHIVFLIVGPTRTLKEAPKHAPDGPYGMGWRYLHVGFLNLETNELEKVDG